MKMVTVHDAKTQLSRYLAEVEETGVEIVIARRNKPVARLVPIAQLKPDRSGLFGAFRNRLSEDVVEYLTSPEIDREIESDFYSEEVISDEGVK